MSMSGGEVVMRRIYFVQSRVAVRMRNRNVPMAFLFRIAHTDAQVTPLIPMSDLIAAKIFPVRFRL